MRKYWLLFETYVFVWRENENVLFYNTLSKEGFTIKLNQVIAPIVSGLMEKVNLRVVEIDEQFYQSKEGKAFISKLRETFCGDILDKSSFPNKPIVILPKLNINEDITRDESSLNNIEGFGSNVLKNLMEVTIHLTGMCNYQCTHCGIIDKQFIWCKKDNGILEKNKLQTLFAKLKHTYIFSINFIGGDILSYPYWDEILTFLDDTSIKRNLYINYIHLTDHKGLLEKLILHNFSIHVLVDHAFTSNLKDVDSRFEYIFSISSVEQYSTVESIINQMDITAKVYPLYTKTNNSFFETYIYQKEEDILHTEWEQKDIFAHQVLNTDFFGKFYITTRGEIFCDPNLPLTGTLDDDLTKLVYEEIHNGLSWRRTRDTVEPCNNCLYKHLCPSPANYETAIGKSNLCHVKK